VTPELQAYNKGVSSESTTIATPPGLAASEAAPAEVSSIDLIIELYKRDVDRTLLIEQLRKTPAQRADDLESACEFLDEMRAAVTRARGR
jgi:hypothetical protein